MPIKKLTIKPTATTMNYGVKTAHIYKGFSSNKSNQNFKTYDVECIRHDIINNFSTRKGERLMNPTYGTIIWDATFEPLTEDLKNSISDDIRQIIQNDPRVIAEDVKVDEYQSGILLEITLRYRTDNLTSVLKLSFDKELGLITE